MTKSLFDHINIKSVNEVCNVQNVSFCMYTINYGVMESSKNMFDGLIEEVFSYQDEWSK